MFDTYCLHVYTKAKRIQPYFVNSEGHLIIGGYEANNYQADIVTCAQHQRILIR